MYNWVKSYGPVRRLDPHPALVGRTHSKWRGFVKKGWGQIGLYPLRPCASRAETSAA